jgi:hypothetical protein
MCIDDIYWRLKNNECLIMQSSLLGLNTPLSNTPPPPPRWFQSLKSAGVKMSLEILGVTTCSSFLIYLLLQKRAASPSRVEDLGNNFFRNVGEYLPDYTESRARRVSSIGFNVWFRWLGNLFIPSSGYEMEAVRSTDVIIIHQTERCHSPDDSVLHSRR